MTAFEPFLDELDAAWTRALPDRLRFRVIGSTALFLQTVYERRTRDGDVLRVERDGFSPPVCKELERLAGSDSALARRHGIYLDLVHAALPYLPEAPLWHGFPGEWTHISVEVLDLTDVCVSKLKRWSGSDRQDLSAMVLCGALEHPRFIERVRSMLRQHAFDARSEELFSKIVERVHEVELEYLALASSSEFEPPDWVG